ncbi:MAG: ribosomal L7Ae/L30e/S12e/Gadd45 family protein [Blautia sp.]|nr:ribosomal L7Ae/L30e/S12e/Gadd45 family protein [Blautia sp.]
MDHKKVLGLAGLAAKAGKAASGEFSTEKSVKSGKGFLVLLAEDASANTRKKFENMCAFYEVPIYDTVDKETLGRAVGKQMRACLSVEDENLAAAIQKALMENSRAVSERKDTDHVKQ